METRLPFKKRRGPRAQKGGQREPLQPIESRVTVSQPTLRAQVQHIRSEVQRMLGRREGEMDKVIPPPVREVYRLQAGATEPLIRKAVQDAVSRNSGPRDLIQLYMDCEDVDSICLQPYYVFREELDLDKMMLEFEKVGNSKSTPLARNEISIKVYRIRMPQGSGRPLASPQGTPRHVSNLVVDDDDDDDDDDDTPPSPQPGPSGIERSYDVREFLDDEAEVDEECDTDIDSDASTVADLIDDTDVQEERPPNPYLDDSRAHAFRHLAADSTLRRALNMGSQQPTPAPRSRRQRRRPGDIARQNQPFFVTQRPQVAQDVEDLTYAAELMTLRVIPKKTLSIACRTNCLPKSIVYAVMHDCLHEQERFPRDLVGPMTEAKWPALMEQIRKDGESNGRRTGRFQAMVDYLMKEAGKDRLSHEECQRLQASWASGVGTCVEAVILGKLLKQFKYSLIVFGARGDVLVDSGFSRGDRPIALLLKDDHYEIIMNTDNKRYCAPCGVFIDAQHACKRRCNLCQNKDCDVTIPDDVVNDWKCQCGRMLRNRQCYSIHVRECKRLCPECYRKKTGRHDCLSWRCYTCQTRAQAGHQCYISAKDITIDGQTWFAFYDLETALVPETVDGKVVHVHVPVMACVAFRCDLCMESVDDVNTGEHQYRCLREYHTRIEVPEKMEDDMSDEEAAGMPLGEPRIGVSRSVREKSHAQSRKIYLDMKAKVPCYTSHTFTGKSCVSELFDCLSQWASNRRKHRNIVVAHNGGNFDHHFLFREMIDRKMKPKLIMKGNSFVSITTSKPRLRLIDSIRFIPLALAQWQKALGLQVQYSKSYWPHKLTAPELPFLDQFPSKADYEYDQMSGKEKKEFHEWYDAQDKTNGFDMRSLMQGYCMTDVQILAEGMMVFAREWVLSRPERSIAATLPMYNKLTLPGAVMEFFRNQYMGLRRLTLPITPVHGYNRRLKASVIGTVWLNEREQTDGRIEREQHIGTDFVFDGISYDEVLNKQTRQMEKKIKCVYDFFGCYYHACECPDGWRKNQEQIEKRPPNKEGVKGSVVRWLSPECLHANIVRRKLFCDRMNLKYVAMKECTYKQDWSNRSPEEKAKFREEYNRVKKELQVPKVKHQKAMLGGRVEVFQLHCKCEPDEVIKALDVSGLYPWILMSCSFCTDHPERLTADEEHVFLSGTHDEQRTLLQAQVNGDVNTVNYFLRIIVVAPRNLRVPLLPAKINGRLMFVNCRSCAEELISKAQDAHICQHTLRERAFECHVHTHSLMLALDLGYRIVEYVDGERYTLTPLVFTEFIASCMKGKKIAEKEGNHGLRLCEKLKANSFWGYLAKRADLPETLICDRKQLLKVLCDNSRRIVSAISLGNVAKLELKTKKKFRKTQSDTSLINASMVTSYARCQLFKYLHLVPAEDLLYCDTDSVFYKMKRDAVDPLKPFMIGEYNPLPPDDPTSDYYNDIANLAGGLEDVLKQEYKGEECEIREFVAAGPKEYGYKVYRKGAQENAEPAHVVCKCKGLTLKGKAFEEFNFQYLMDLVYQRADLPLITQPLRIRPDKRSVVRTIMENKQPKFTFTKRIYGHVCEPGQCDRTCTIMTLPFGYSEEEDDAPPNVYKPSIPKQYEEAAREREEAKAAKARHEEWLLQRQGHVKDLIEPMLEIAEAATNEFNSLREESKREYETMTRENLYRGFTDRQRARINARPDDWMDEFDVDCDGAIAVHNQETGEVITPARHPRHVPLVHETVQLRPLTTEQLHTLSGRIITRDNVHQLASEFYDFASEPMYSRFNADKRLELFIVPRANSNVRQTREVDDDGNVTSVSFDYPDDVHFTVVCDH